jgi:hypothetical protein
LKDFNEQWGLRALLNKTDYLPEKCVFEDRLVLQQVEKIQFSGRMKFERVSSK